ncbi:MAG: hypothetical protein JWR18_167 [Segetibacter sp.]|nr:hypothetical protein [Segetibacter sp.]
MEPDKIAGKPIKIWFTDMWKGFDFEDNYFTIILKRYFNIILSPDPDFLIHSVYTKNYLKYNCCRICFTGENTRPDFTRSDFHIGFDFNDSPNYLRWPLYLMGRYIPEYLLEKKDPDAICAQKKRFCSFVVSNDSAKERIALFYKLSEYKNVDSGGKFLNNIGGPVSDKLEFLRGSKFNVAFENESYPGYVTEKIFDAFLTNCIPIYWGSPRIEEDFNKKAFLNMHRYKTYEELVEYIQYLDENDEAYKAILRESAFPANEIPERFRVEKFVDFFQYIFKESKKNKPVYRYENKIEYFAFKCREKSLQLRSKLLK